MKAWFLTGCSTGLDDCASTAGVKCRALRAKAGKEGGDPRRNTSPIIEAVASDNPSKRSLLGNDAYDWAMAKLDDMRTELKRGSVFTPCALATFGGRRGCDTIDPKVCRRNARPCGLRGTIEIHHRIG